LAHLCRVIGWRAFEQQFNGAYHYQRRWTAAGPAGPKPVNSIAGYVLVTD
jgi:hypothetical protein